MKQFADVLGGDAQARDQKVEDPVVVFGDEDPGDALLSHRCATRLRPVRPPATGPAPPPGSGR